MRGLRGGAVRVYRHPALGVAAGLQLRVRRTRAALQTQGARPDRRAGVSHHPRGAARHLRPGF